MFIVDFSSPQVRYVFFKKSILGKYEIQDCGIVDSNEPDWEDQLYKVLKNQKVALVLPEKTTKIIRFTSPENTTGDEVKELVEKTIREEGSIGDFAYDCGLKKRDDGSNEILCIAAANRDLVDIFSLMQEFDAKPIMALPESLAVFRILRDGIIEGEVVLLIDIEEDSTNFIFFDSTGPIVKASQKTDLLKLDKATNKVKAEFEKEYNLEINRIVLHGTECPQIDPYEFRKSVDILTIKAEDILKDRLTKANLQFDSGGENIGRYLNAIAAGLLTEESSTLNLVKNDVLMNVEKEAMKHTEESKKDITESTGEETEEVVKSSKRPQLMAESVDDTPDEEIEEVEIKEEVLEKKEPVLEKKEPMSHTIGSPDSQFRSSFRADESKSGSGGGKKKILLFLIVALVVAVIAGIVLFFLGGDSATTGNSNTAPTQQPTPSPTPTPELDRADLTLQVLNGSGVAGAAGNLASALEDLGYADGIEVGNADADDYEETVIQLQEEFADYFDMLKEDLENEGYVVEDEYEELDSNATTDGVIILGSLNENQAEEDVTPTPEEEEEEEDTTPTPTPEE